MKIARTLTSGLAVATLAIAGAAHADTRSSSAIPATTPASADISRGSAAATAEEDIAGAERGPGVILLVLAILAILAGILAAAGGNDSPG